MVHGRGCGPENWQGQLIDKRALPRKIEEIRRASQKVRLLSRPRALRTEPGFAGCDRGQSVRRLTGSARSAARYQLWGAGLCLQTVRVNLVPQLSLAQPSEIRVHVTKRRGHFQLSHPARLLYDGSERGCTGKCTLFILCAFNSSGFALWCASYSWWTNKLPKYTGHSKGIH